ncbi:hypothetical protein HOD08_03110 [bacterium]|nr:hypothetical protein [bacterium]
MSKSCSSKHDCCTGNFFNDIAHHLPCAIFAVGLSIILTGILTAICPDLSAFAKNSRQLFHTLHYVHLLFASTGTVLVYRKISNAGIFSSILVGTITPAIFCTLSDAVLPCIGGQLLGLNVEMHWCFLHHFTSVLPFLALGVFNGILVSSRCVDKTFSSTLTYHSAHIFVSAMASMLYLVAYGLSSWGHYMGSILCILVVAVVVPCTLSDLVIPTLCAKLKGGQVDR